MSNRSKKIKRAKLISGTVLMVLFLLLIAALKIIDVQTCMERYVPASPSHNFDHCRTFMR